MLMHEVAHGRCTNTVRESALNVDSGREKKSLAALGTGTRVSIVPGFSVGRCSYPAPLRVVLVVAAAVVVEVVVVVVIRLVLVVVVVVVGV